MSGLDEGQGDVRNELGEKPPSEPELPEELDLGPDFESPVVVEEPNEDLPNELPLFLEVEDQPQIAGGDGAPASLAPSPPDASLRLSEDMAEVGVEHSVAQKEQVSVFKRRGRPNRALQEAMRQALGHSAMGPSSSMAGSVVATIGDGHLAVAVLPAGRAADAHAKRRELVKKATVEPSDPGALAKQPIRGLCPPPGVAEATLAASQLGGMLGEQVDDEAFSVSCGLLADAPMPMASKRLRAETLGVDEEKLDVLGPLVGSAIVLLDRVGRANLEKTIAVRISKPDLLLYCDFVAYDETPLPVALRAEGLQQSSPTSHPGSSQLVPANAGAIQCSVGIGSLLGSRLNTQQGSQKVLQTIQTGGILLHLAGQYVSILPSTVCPLTVIDRGTATCLKAALLRACGVSRASELFGTRMRLVCTDRNGANLLAEKSIAAERGEHWSSLHVHCEVHLAASAHEKTFSLQESNISGMIHCALALRNGTAMNRFRRCLRDEVASRFRVRFGTAPLDAIEHKRKVLRLFVSHGPQLAMKRILLALCPNGDWRSDQVEHYVPAFAQQPLSESAMLDHVTSGLIAALCASQPSVYPRSRWTGADLATDCLGVLEACHRLLSTTFLRFASTFESLPRATRLLAEASGLANNPAMPSLLALEDAPSGQDDEGGAAGDLDGGGALAGSVEATPKGNGKGATWAEVNAFHRRCAVRWLLGKPLGPLILQRLVMEPLRQLLRTQLTIAGDAWENEQRRKVLSSSVESPNPFGQRDYRLGLAAEMNAERSFFQRLRALFQENVFWEMIPVGCHTTAFRSLAFRLLSRAGCAVHELFVRPHKRLPFQVFRLLKEPELAAELVKTPPCMVDEWTKKLLQQHPDLSGTEFLQKLSLVALMAWKDIAQVEARHASVRRILAAASLQTRRQALKDLSAYWCCLQFRKRRQKHMLAPSTRPRKVKKRVIKKRGRKGWGGLWRAYIRNKSFGKPGTPCLKTLAKAYEDEKEKGGKDMDKLVEVGAAATLAGRICPPKAGASSFGPKLRDVQAQRVRELRQALTVATRSMEKDEGALAVANRLTLVGADIATCLTVARSVLQQRSRQDKERNATAQKDLEEFVANAGQQHLKKVSEAIPDLPAGSLVPVPCAHGWCFECGPAQRDSIAQAVAWSFSSKQANTSATLRRYWDSQHLALLEGDCNTVQDVVSPPRECFVAGVCLCTPQGQQLRSLKNAFLRIMKRDFPQRSDLRKDLAAGNVVVELMGFPKDDDMDAYLEEENPVKQVLLHVGMMYFSPYQPTFLLAKWRAADPDRGIPQRSLIEAP